MSVLIPSTTSRINENHQIIKQTYATRDRVIRRDPGSDPPIAVEKYLLETWFESGEWIQMSSLQVGFTTEKECRPRNMTYDSSSFILPSE